MNIILSAIKIAKSTILQLSETDNGRVTFPIINLKDSVNHARESFKKVRTTPNFRELSNEVFKKHGSRKKSSKKQTS